MMSWIVYFPYFPSMPASLECTHLKVPWGLFYPLACSAMSVVVFILYGSHNSTDVKKHRFL